MRYLRKETAFIRDGKIIIPDCFRNISHFNQGADQRVFIEAKSGSIIITTNIAHANATIQEQGIITLPNEILANIALYEIALLYLQDLNTIEIFPYDPKKHDTSSTTLADNFFNIENKQEILQIRFSDIYYFEKIKGTHNTCIVFHGGISTFKSDLHEVLKQLDSGFVQCHKAFIVNTTKIKRIEKLSTYCILHFNDNHSCPCSMFYKKAVLKNWNH